MNAHTVRTRRGLAQVHTRMLLEAINWASVSLTYFGMHTGLLLTLDTPFSLEILPNRSSPE